jgi:hypothetical protein
MLKQVTPFVFRAESSILTGRSRGDELLQELTEVLRASDPDSVTPLDFSHIQFMDISCADECLTKLLMRIGSGELGTRYVFLTGGNESVRETVEAVMKLRGLAVMFRGEDGVQILGTLKTPIREALEVMTELKSATSSEISRALNKNVNIACNRLNALQRMGLVCRLKDGSVEGGGRQFFYESIV